MLRKKLFVPVLGVSALLLGSGIAVAKPAPHARQLLCRCRPAPTMLRHRLRLRHMLRFRRQLKKLPTTQQKAVKNILTTARAQAKPTRQLLFAKRTELKAAFLEPKLNQKRIMGLETEITKLRNNLFRMRIETALKIKSQTGLVLPRF